MKTSDAPIDLLPAMQERSRQWLERAEIYGSEIGHVAFCHKYWNKLAEMGDCNCDVCNLSRSNGTAKVGDVLRNHEIIYRVTYVGEYEVRVRIDEKA